MFGKLKDKLKGALSIFSKSAEAEAEEKVIEVEEEVKEKKVVKEKKESKKTINMEFR